MMQGAKPIVVDLPLYFVFIDLMFQVTNLGAMVVVWKYGSR